MFRNDFLRHVMNMGMMTLTEIRQLENDKNPNVVSEMLLLKNKNFDESKFLKINSERTKLEIVDLSVAHVSTEILSVLNKTNVVKYRAIPIQKDPGTVILATYDPTVLDLSDELKQILKLQIKWVMTTLSDWAQLYSRVTKTAEEVIKEMELINTDNVEEDANAKVEEVGEETIEVVNKLLAEAFVRQASDIHIEPYETYFRVRLRIDGVLVEILKQQKNSYRSIAQRIKIMCRMDITERRKPQDGRIKLKIGQNNIDYRVSSLPTLFGEKIVLRLLDSSSLQLDMTKLGFEAPQLKVFKEGIYKPFGMCLVTGPTGSGKTTTLYSAISELNQIHSNISTVEDPVEFNLQGINQVNVKMDVGLNFASALKSFLRQDPDIIMVGEIRDFETAEIAVEAALTGHLVLSTLHTNDAPSTVTRLLNMGVEPFLIVGALNVVVAQRLCRKICNNCKEVAENINIDMLVSLGISKSSAEKMKIYKGKGCRECNQTGYRGRVAIYEVLNMTPNLRDLIFKNVSSEEFKRAAIKEGMKTLRMAALTKVAQGMTTIEEALSNSSGD